MSKNTPKQRVDQLKDWIGWIAMIAKKKKKKQKQCLPSFLFCAQEGFIRSKASTCYNGGKG